MIKKAQIQLGESIFVVMIIILIIVFGLVFSSQAEKDVVTQRSEKFTNLNSIMLGKYASSLAELRCSSLEVQELSCFDIQKIEAFIELQEKQSDFVAEYYFTKLGDANISLDLIYPVNKTFEIYYNGLGKDNLGKPIKAEENRIIIPVSAYDDVTQQYSFGVLQIIQYNPIQ